MSHDDAGSHRICVPMRDFIYLDNNATTKPLPEVVEAMLEVLQEAYANPSSVHQFGQLVRHRVECAREQVATLIGATPREIVFTSGGTESLNLAIRGALQLHPDRRHVVTTAVEHAAVKRLAEDLEENGFTVDCVGVDRRGCLDEEQWNKSLSDDTALASIIHANNETGVLFDVARIAAVAAERGITVHVDAIQSAGKLPIDVSTWPVQFVSLSAHKFHGPKGVGALYVRRRTRLAPLILGGGQERLRRGGTEHVAGIVGMGVAAEIAMKEQVRTAADVRELRDSLEVGILATIPGAHINGAGGQRIHNTTNISFEGLEAEAILLLLSEAGICASSGAACSSGSLEPSHVLKAMGISERIAHGAIRFSLSRFNTEADVERVLSAMPSLLSKLTAVSRS